jgi:hypothetical protein
LPEPVKELLAHDNAEIVGVAFDDSGAISEIENDFAFPP